MRDTTKELDAALKGLKQLNDRQILLNGLIAVSMLCVPILTISTVLWQWLG
jgi:hypothetical protein